MCTQIELPVQTDFSVPQWPKNQSRSQVWFRRILSVHVFGPMNVTGVMSNSSSALGIIVSDQGSLRMDALGPT